MTCESTPGPVDPFPDLTIMDVPGYTVVTGNGELIQLVLPHPMAVRILARDEAGEPSLIQPA